MRYRMKENGATSGHPLAQDPLQQECGGADPLQAAQAALFQAEANYRDLVERLPLIIYIDEPNASSSNIYTSPQTAAILGYTPEEWASDPHFFPAILHPDDRERVLAEHARTHATGEPLRTEYRLIRRDGQEVCVRDEAVLIHDEDGNAVRLQGYMLDISEAKQRETALLESAAIVGSSFDAVVGRTPEGLVTSWNAAAERIFGYGADEMIGRSITILAPPERADELGVINDTLLNRPDLAAASAQAAAAAAQEAALAKRTPLQAVATPEQVAQAVMGFIRSDLVTGQHLVVDGGLNVTY